MNTEDYKRALRVTKEIKPEDKAALVVVLKDDSLFVSHMGEPEDFLVLLERYSIYLENIYGKEETK